MTRRIESLDALVLLSSAVALILLLPLRDASTAFPPVSFAAALVLFMTPGVLLAHWLLKGDISGPALVPVGFAISTGVFGLLGIPLLIAHRSIEAYLWAAGAVLAASLLAAAWRTLRARAPAAGEGVPDGPPASWLWAPFALLGGALAFVSTRRVPNKNDDIWVYLSWVRDYASADRLALRDPYFGERTQELARVHVNGWLLEQAALSRISGLDTIELVLRYLTPTLVIVALLAVYALARALLKSEKAAVLIGSLYALFHLVFIEPKIHNIGAQLAARIPEDKYAARFLILPMALLFAVLFVRSRRRRHLGVFAFFCWAVVAVHPVVLPVIGLCMLGFGLAHVAANPRRRAAWTGMAALALAMWSVALVPVLLLLSGESPAAVLYSADINSAPPEVLEQTVFIAESWGRIHEFDDGSYIMHPWLILNPVILGTYALGVPFLLSRARRSLAAQLLLGGLLAATVAVYVPPVATFIGEELIVPDQLERLSWPIPLLALLTAGWLAWEALGCAEARLLAGFGRRGARVLPLALVTALLAAAAPPAIAKAVSLYREYEVARTSNYHPDPIYPWVQDNIKEPSVLLAPDSASTAVPAYSASVDVVSYRSEAMIRDREILERRAGSKIDFPRRYLDVHRFYLGPVLDEEAYEILRRYKVDYLMVYADGPLDERLETLPGFSAVSAAPRQKFSLYAVDLRELGEPPRSHRLDAAVPDNREPNAL